MIRQGFGQWANNGPAGRPCGMLGAVVNPDQFECRAFLAKRQKGCPARCRIEQQQASVGVTEDVGIARGSVVWIEAHDDETRTMRSKIVAYPVDAVGQQNRYALSRMQARCRAPRHYRWQSAGCAPPC